MICPKCGATIKDDNVYCEICGEEIHFVPFFEPEIEQSINDNLSGISIDDSYGNDFSSTDFENNNFSNVDDFDFSGEITFDESQYENLNNNSSRNNNNSVQNNVYDSNNQYADNMIDLNNDAYLNEEDAFNNEYQDEYQDEYVDEYEDDDEYDDEYEDDDEYDDEYEDDDEYDDEYDDDDYYDEEFSKDPFDDFEYESELFHKFVDFLRYSKARWLVVVALSLVIILILTGVFLGFNKYRKNNSIDYQYEKAVEYASEGDYKTAISYINKAISLKPSDSSKKLILADYYFKDNNPDSGVLTLWEIIQSKDDNSESAYQKLINYYISLEDYAMINDVLQDCDNPSILEKYNEYLASNPEFSVEEGTYDDVVELQLSSLSNGKIYYTTDGSNPTYESNLYTGTITMDDLGQHTITAFFVNSHGIESEIVKKTYLIDIVQPNPPNVLLESGNYNIPVPIEVDVQRYCDVYYTTDGTPPTIKSSKYEGPIFMPIGQSHFIFVAFSQENKQGEITERDFNLSLDSDVDVTSLQDKLLTYDYLIHKTVDLEGHLPSSTTKYQYAITEAVTFMTDGNLLYLDHGTETEDEKSDFEKLEEIDEEEIEIYYILTESMIDIYGKSSKTGTFYLVDLEEGKIFRASLNDEGVPVKGEELTEQEYTNPNPVPNPNPMPGEPLPPGDTVNN